MTASVYVAERVPPYGTDSVIRGSFPEAKLWLKGCVNDDLTETRNANALPPEIVYLYTPG